MSNVDAAYEVAERGTAYFFKGTLEIHRKENGRVQSLECLKHLALSVSLQWSWSVLRSPPLYCNNDRIDDDYLNHGFLRAKPLP